MQHIIQDKSLAQKAKKTNIAIPSSHISQISNLASKFRLALLASSFMLFGISGTLTVNAQTPSYLNSSNGINGSNAQVDKIDPDLNSNNANLGNNTKKFDYGVEPEKFSRIDGQTSVLTQSNSQGQYLEPDLAFKHSARAQEGEMVFTLEPSAKYYLYKEKISAVQISPTKDYSNSIEALPTGEMKNDPTFGRVEIYRIPLEVRVKLNKLVPDSLGESLINFTYQGCHDDGLCYAPISKFYSYKNNSLTLIEEPLFYKNKINVNNSNQNSNNSQIKNVGVKGEGEDNFFTNKNLFFIFISFLIAGMALSLTPCVLPMAPILFSIITRFNKASSKTTPFTISLAYVMGMTLTYTLIGILAAFSGSLLSSAFQNVAVVAGISIIFVVLALGMLGLYTIQIPAVIQDKLLSVSNGVSEKNKISGIFLMGAVSAFVLGPCVAAPMAGALLYIGQTRDVLTGAIALFALSLGMGVPLLLLGLSAGKILPKAGHWMEYITKIFGLILLGFAIFIVSPIIPPIISMLMWASLAIFFGLYLYTLKFRHLPMLNLFVKMLSIIALIYGATILVGAASGSKNPVKPLQALMEKDYVSSKNIDWKKVTTVAGLDMELARAKSEGKAAIVDFYALWCASCIEMDNYTFSDKMVVDSMDKMYAIKLDITKNDSASKELLKRYGLYGPPAIIFYDSKGVEVSPRVIGYQKPAVFLNTLEKNKNK